MSTVTLLVQVFYFPEEAGYAIGGDDDSIPDYYLLEMHYDNPQLLNSMFF